MIAPEKITCAGCGKQYDVTIDNTGIGEKQTVIAKCSCGATTEISGLLKPKPGKDTFGQINELLAKLPMIIQSIRETKMEGMDTGIGQAVSELSKEIALEVLEGDFELREALKEHVTTELRRYLLGPTEGEQPS